MIYFYFVTIKSESVWWNQSASCRHGLWTPAIMCPRHSASTCCRVIGIRWSFQVSHVFCRILLDQSYEASRSDHSILNLLSTLCPNFRDWLRIVLASAGSTDVLDGHWASRLLYVVPWWKCKQYLLNSKVRAGRAKYRLYLFLRYCYERTPLYCYLVRGGQTTGLIEVRKMMLTVGLILRVTKVPETGETNRMKQSYVSNTCLWKKLTTCPSVHNVCTTGKMVHVFIDFMAKNLLVILSNKMERVWSKTCTWAVWLFMRSNSIKDKNRTSNRHTQCSVY